MNFLLALVVIGGALYVLHRLALWAEGRGWVYYSRRKPSRTALGNAFLEAQAIVEPGKRLVLEARREEPRAEDASGEPPEPTGGREGDGDGGQAR
jgi:hypothetical protein